MRWHVSAGFTTRGAVVVAMYTRDVAHVMPAAHAHQAQAPGHCCTARSMMTPLSYPPWRHCKVTANTRVGELLSAGTHTATEHSKRPNAPVVHSVLPHIVHNPTEHDAVELGLANCERMYVSHGHHAVNSPLSRPVHCSDW